MAELALETSTFTQKSGIRGSLGFNEVIFAGVPDARTVTDAAITSGDATLTSATASFVAGDVGKSVGIEGAGASGLPLVTTILTVTNGTTVELAANAGGTVSGKRAVIGTDNVPLIQDAIDLIETAGGGRLVIPAGQYFLATACDATNNAQVYFPARNLSTQKEFAFAIEGAQRPAPNSNWLEAEAQPLSTGGTILISMASPTDATDGIFGGTYPGGATWTLSAIRVSVKNITFRTYSNPKLTPLCLRDIGQADVEGVLIDTGCTLDDVTEPTLGGVGIIMPKTNNWTVCRVKDVDVIGHAVGIRYSEHTSLDEARVWLCKIGYQPTDTNHASRAGHLLAVGCEKVLQFANTYTTSNPHRVFIGCLANERTVYTNWKDTDTVVDNTTGIGKGIINVASVASNTGEVEGVTTSGSLAKLLVADLSDPFATYGAAAGSDAVLLFRFIADDLGLADDTTVTTWTKNGGTGSNATAAGTPKLRTNVLNTTHDVVRFDGTEDYLDGTCTLTGTTATVFAVLKWDASASAGDGMRILGLRKNDTGATDHGFGTPDDGAAIMVATVSSDSVGVYRGGDYRALETISDNVWHILCVKWDGTNSYVSVDGGAFESAADAFTFDVGIFRIGADAQEGITPTEFFKGDMAEIALYSGLRSDAEITAEIAALGVTYGITTP